MFGPVQGMTVDSNGTLYVSAQENQVFEFPRGQTKGKGINLPVGTTGVTLDSHGNLICAFNGGGAAGVLQLTKASPVPKNLLIPLEASTADVLFDAGGNLVVEDLDGAYINVYPPGSTKPSQTIDAAFVNPVHMAFDSPRQNLYVSDFGNNTVKVIAYPSGNVRWQIAGFGEVQGVAVSPAAIP
jgi:DNA-binding beta-propeller fold protein YncE